jgi:pimeloyl-ACP methyl ester carboxylesterase
MGAMPSFCIKGEGLGGVDVDVDRPVRLKPSVIKVAAPWGPIDVKVWIGGRGFPVVVLHGLSANSRIYLLWLGFLALFVKVIAMDLPGHGGTDKLPQEQEFMEGSGILLNCVLDSLGINYAGIIGHSLGGRIACEAASRNPERVVVLILVDSVTGDAWDKRMRNVRRMPLLVLPLAMEFLQDLGSLISNIQRTDHSGQLVRMGFDTYMGHVRHPMRSLLPTTKKLIDASPSVTLLEQIAAAGIATIVIRGEHDQLVTMASAESTARITHARLIIVEDAGHSWVLQNRETARHILVHGLSDSETPESLGNILAGAIRRLLRLDPTVTTQSDLEGSGLYGPGSLAVALTPNAERWAGSIPFSASERRVAWKYHPAG